MEIGAVSENMIALPDRANPPAQAASNPSLETEDSKGKLASADEMLSAQAKLDLTDQEKRKLEELKRTDRDVRAHEMAHMATAGQYSRGGPTYVYERGPDGQLYAVGGEVNLDVSEVQGNPEATIRKMQQVRQAALAPRDPSPQDRHAAAEATMREAAARRKALEMQRDEMLRDGSDPLNVTLQSVARSGYTDMFPIQQLLSVVV